MRQDLSLGEWRIKILAELDAMQRELREKMAPRAENPVRKASVVQPPVRSVQVPSRKPSQQRNRTTIIKSSAVRLPVVTEAVKKVQVMRKVSAPTPTSASVQTHPLPSIVKARSSFWRGKNASALATYPKPARVDDVRQSRAAQTVEAYSKLSVEERRERAARMQAEYEAECQRLGM